MPALPSRLEQWPPRLPPLRRRPRPRPRPRQLRRQLLREHRSSNRLRLLERHHPPPPPQAGPPSPVQSLHARNLYSLRPRYASRSRLPESPRPTGRWTSAESMSVQQLQVPSRSRVLQPSRTARPSNGPIPLPSSGRIARRRASHRLLQPLARLLPYGQQAAETSRYCAGRGPISCRRSRRLSAVRGPSWNPMPKWPSSMASSLRSPSPPRGWLAHSVGQITQRIFARRFIRPSASTARSMR